MLSRILTLLNHSLDLGHAGFHAEAPATSPTSPHFVSLTVVLGLGPDLYLLTMLPRTQHCDNETRTAATDPMVVTSKHA